MELEQIKSSILEIRGKKVLLDTDLAKIYEVETRVLKQAVRRNIDRFPEDFMFELTELEMQNTFARFTSGGGTNGRDRIDVNPHHNVVDYLLSKVEFNHETIGHLARRQALKLLEIKIALSVIMANSDWKNPDTQFTKEDFDAMVKDSVLTLQARQCIDQLKELRDSIDDLEKQARAGLLPEEDPILSAKQQKWQEAGVRMPVFWEE